ncbi:hypothetical protein M409DRAFT_18883 [Zasmidium cellare ATCC 36951]|uniref:ATP-dependent DNA ligase family profile domain-containing protein n=1 Tax=Zasmidium cellare ATCC 36951 TaxID=1080233 RepID=A0A6A6CXG7_ZASCE|nr:uncharacterized protein M409DRAFT_18883 [Zasmidium cellare ATCC 36951]KAF2170910.1 hypothetical protein M409DRAFT_18883 [Zasmidium cellare ATCC 36951]
MPLPFGEICTLLSRLEEIETSDPPVLPKDKYPRTKEIIESWFKSHRRPINELDAEGTAALLSTLLPEWRTDRVHGIQTANLYRILCRAMELGITRRPILEQYKQPGKGDIGLCLERVMRLGGGPPAKPVVMVEEVDDMLQMLAGGSRHSGPSIPRLPPSSSEQRDKTIGNILFRCEPNEGKWLARLILKDFSPVRIDEKLILKNLHFLLEDLLNFQRDFHAAATLLKGEFQDYPCRPDPMSERLHKRGVAARMRPVVGIKVGRPKFDKARDVKYVLSTLAGKEWALERKYDGEYCEIHVDLQKSTDPKQCITIFAKSGKDSTQDKKGLHDTLVKSLRLGQPDCRFERQAILLGEMVVYSDEDREIMPFEKIRKHVTRSGVSIGTDADSQPHDHEHLAIVFFDLLLLDDEVVMNRPVNERRNWLRETYLKIPGRAIGAEWRTVDFSDIESGEEKLLQQFAAAIARRTEGLVLKPLNVPYFSLEGDAPDKRYIKVKKDYLKGLGDEADFAVIGASYNAQQAATSGLKAHAVKWTTFHLGCLTNQEDVRRNNARPDFQYVGSIDQEKCIPRPILEAANNEATFRAKPYDPSKQPESFDIRTFQVVKMDHVFNEPLVFEVLGSGFEKPSNRNFFMLRHPRVKKMHEDRSWIDCITFEQLQEQGEVSRAAPEDSEFQETRRWIKRLEELLPKHRRKVEREKTASPKSRKTITPPTTGPRRPRQLQSPMEPQLKRMVNELPTPLPSFGVERLPSSPSQRPPLFQRQSSKRQREDTSRHLPLPKKARIESNEKTPDSSRSSVISTPLAELSTNIDPPSAREASRQTQRSRALSELTRKVAAFIGPSRTPSTPSNNASPTPPCSGSKCPFASATVYLTPCISKTLYITEDLLSMHNIHVVTSLSHWDRASFAHSPLPATVSESQSHPGMRKIVLVERKRRAAVRDVVKRIQGLTGGAFRERVEVWDWRVLEECKKHDRGTDKVNRHFLGATVWDSRRERPMFVKECDWL